MDESLANQARDRLSPYGDGPNRVAMELFFREGTEEAYAAALGAASVEFGPLTESRTIPWRAIFADGSELSAEIGVT